MTNHETRVLIFGLRRGTRPADLHGLLGAFRDARLDLLDLPGDNDDAFAVVHLRPDPSSAWRLAQGINARRLHGRRLQSWVPVMAWA